MFTFNAITCDANSPRINLKPRHNEPKTSCFREAQTRIILGWNNGTADETKQ